MTPEELLSLVWPWLYRQLALHPEVRPEILTEEPDALCVILHFPACMAELLIHRPHCAPYHSVCFEALPWDGGAAPQHLFWYDEAGDTAGEILSHLQEIFSAALSFARDTDR